MLNSPLRYEEESEQVAGKEQTEIGYLKLRYKLPGESKSTLLEQPISEVDRPEAGSELETDSRFAAAVAAFGQKLRGQTALSDFTYKHIADLAESNRGNDGHGHRSNFIQLVRLTEALSE